MNYAYLLLKEKLNRKQISRVGKHFCSLKQLKKIRKHLGISNQRLNNLVSAPTYYTFRLPKPVGGHRLIETPKKYLKHVQRYLNHSLQCVYHSMRPKSVYGFVISASNEPDPRTIYTNAERHLKSKWVLNIDLKDFFHSIDINRVFDIFRSKPFKFTKEAAQALAKLTTYKNRLPMGAPSSPVISNFACLDLDKKLTQLAQKKGWIYTRFADDITISGNQKFNPRLKQQIFEVIESEGFSLNMEKIKQFHASDPPIVTGLIIGKKKPDVSPTYLKGIKSDFKILHWLITGKEMTQDIFRRDPIFKLIHSLKGKINFIGYIRGYRSKTYIRLRRRLYRIMDQVYA